MKDKKVIGVEFQTPVFVPGWGDSKTSIPSPNKTITDLAMELKQHGLEIKGKSQDVMAYFLVPYANIKHIRFDLVE